ncbi:ADIRF [Cervus elaphus hippelaphus]|uniref:ADIRF n=5 Tax=Cervidae TaxID=9850 RepID=A0A212CN98_CEREH|nr:ADIRF [Cervus elaphus hippelaphus]
MCLRAGGLFEQDPTSLRLPLTTRRPPAAMASKGLQDLKKQVEGAAQEAVTSAGTAAQQVVDQATEAGQKAMDQVAKTTQETIDKTANQASETFSGFGKKFGLLK